MHRGRRGAFVAGLVGFFCAASLTGCNDALLTPIRSAPPPLDCQNLETGYATVDGLTTGGLGGANVEVTTFAELQSAAMREDAVIIRIKGTLSGADQVRVSSNKTLFGKEAGDGLVGGGLYINKAENVIVQNLTISKVAHADAIGVQVAKHVWIDHCDLSSDRDHDSDYYDGLVDITHQSDDVTVSWCRFHDHARTSLVGHSQTNAAEDTGHLTVTYHHNLFVNVDEGSPRVRFGTVHVFNDLYEDNSAYAIASQMSAIVLIERSVFRRVEADWLTHYQDDVDGFIIARENDAGGGTTSSGAPPPSNWTPPYPYTADSLTSVPALVQACAGTGKIAPSL